jgi:hypothetical protein
MKTPVLRLVLSGMALGTFFLAMLPVLEATPTPTATPIRVTADLESLSKDLVDITNVFADHLAQKTPISADDLTKACSVLMRFTESKDFYEAITASVAGQNSPNPNGAQPDLKTDFVAFIDQFLTPEAKILKKSGVNDAQSTRY